MSFLQTYTGNFTAYTSKDITIDFVMYENFFKNWTVEILTNSYAVTSNDSSKLFFTNSLSAIGAYKLTLLNRYSLSEIDDYILDSIRVSDVLLNKKISLAIQEIQNKVYRAFIQYKNDTFDFLDYVMNTGELKLSLSYLTLALLYEDLALVNDDNYIFKRDMYMQSYKRTIMEAIDRLIIDTTGTGSNLTQGKPSQNFLIR